MPTFLTGFSRQLWNSHGKRAFQQICETPFTQAFIRGLTPDEFLHFIQQDILYLNSFHQIMVALETKAPTTPHRELFAGFRADTEKEMVMLRQYLTHYDRDESLHLSPACEAYSTHLLSVVAQQSYPVTIASCLPCFLFFPLLGLHVKRGVRHLDQHPQNDWIKIYSEDLFDNSSKMVAIMNETSTDPHQEARAFAQSAAHELAFFEEALPQSARRHLPTRRW